MLTFRRTEAGRYEATAPSGAQYKIWKLDDGSWRLSRNGTAYEPPLATLTMAKETANAVALMNNDDTAPEAEPAAPVIPFIPPTPAPAADAYDAPGVEAIEAAAAGDEAPAAPAEEAPAPAPAGDDAPQFTLIPEARPEGRLANVALSRIRQGRVQGAPDDLIESVRRYGILQPVALIQSGRNEFEIADGRRRVSAAEIAELGAVPALIFPEGTPRHVAAAITLTTNMQRRPNPASELEAIQQMVHDGANVEQIASELRLSTFVIRRRMALANLIPEFRDALLTEELSVTTAQRIARHPHEEQRRLLGIWRETGRVTAEDRAAERRARRGEQVDAVPVHEAHPVDLNTLTVEELAAFGARMGVRFVMHPLDGETLDNDAPAVDPEIDARAEAVARTLPAPAAPEADLPAGQGWTTVLACLVRAEESIPVAPDDHTDAFYADLSGLLERVRRIVRAQAPAAAA